MSRRTHVNSLLAYWEGQESLFSKREKDILRTVRSFPGSRATDRAIMTRMGFSDPNCVRPRITELVADGLLAEVGQEDDPMTGKRVRVVAMIYPAQSQLVLPMASNAGDQPRAGSAATPEKPNPK